MNTTQHLDKLDNTPITKSGNVQFAQRMQNVQPSFIREILTAAGDPSLISFAGGLPDPTTFPVDTLSDCCQEVMRHDAQSILQYGRSEGEPALRESVANHYQQFYGLTINPENILITTGSQQGLDLLSKVLINPADKVVVESPGYLGAIQAMSMYQCEFMPIPLNDDGIQVDKLATALESDPRFMYCVPNFQNPTGRSYSAENKAQIAGLVKDKPCFIVEDDPYGLIRFSDDQTPSFYSSLPDQTILLGSFSKIISPGLRVGWIVAPEAIMEKIIIAKQAADLHTARLPQALILGYLKQSNLNHHIKHISQLYGERCERMGQLIDHHFPSQVIRSAPGGGMFMWLEFCCEMDTEKLFAYAQKEGVVFVPGLAFYVGDSDCLTAQQKRGMRLNFSCSNLDQLEQGMQRLKNAVEKYYERVL